MKCSSPVRLGIVGWPVAHSLSPAMHNAAFKSVGLQWHYELWPTPPAELSRRMGDLRSSNIAGANVTVPHKQSVIPYLDQLTPAAAAIGAVNTIVAKDSRLSGHNTDAEGFLAALREAGVEPVGRRVLLLGAGGAARAVAFALLTARVSRLVIANRSMARARSLVQDTSAWQHESAAHAVELSRESLQKCVVHADLVINATTLGMAPDASGCPWPLDLPMPARLVVCDLVYSPRTTRLLELARAAGCKTIDGLGMLVHQGAQAFQLWTGLPAPVALMRQVCLAAVSKAAAPVPAASEPPPGPQGG